MFALDTEAVPLASFDVRVRRHERVIHAGRVEGYGLPIRGHDGKPVYRAIATSPWRALPETFWTPQSAVHWLETVAGVEA